VWARIPVNGISFHRNIEITPSPSQQLYRPLYSPWLAPREFLPYYELAAPRTVVSPDRCYVLYSLLKQAILNNGNVWECGVYNCGTAAMMLAMRPKRSSSRAFLLTNALAKALKCKESAMKSIVLASFCVDDRVLR